MRELALDDGRLVRLGGRATNGSKNETCFGWIGQMPVVVKIQRAHGNPREEEAALRVLAAAGVRVPRVVGSGTTSDSRAFLVISREAGGHPETPAGWARFGRDLAGLLEVPIAACPFRRVEVAEFVTDHRQRLSAVRPLLGSALADEIDHAVEAISSTDSLAVTHGDPGTGNYLDAGDDDRPGVLLDWETASVSPFGLDFGRALFICMLDLRASGIAEQLAPAFIDGYLTRSAVAVPLSESLQRAWTTVAGLQFIHGRHLRPLVPERTPEAAARTLESYLAVAR